VYIYVGGRFVETRFHTYYSHRTSDPRPLVFCSRGESFGRAAIKTNHRLCGSPVFLLGLPGGGGFFGPLVRRLSVRPPGYNSRRARTIGSFSPDSLCPPPGVFLVVSKEDPGAVPVPPRMTLLRGFCLSVYPTPLMGRMQCGKSSLICRGGVQRPSRGHSDLV
jgi:hypothetical protein